MANESSLDIIPEASEKSSNSDLVQLRASYAQVEHERPVVNLFDKILHNKHLFVDRELLSSSYIPEILPHREQEIAELAEILAPALDIKAPSNVILYGVPGCGKTATVKTVAKDLERKATDIGKLVKVVYVNCQYTNTVYRIINALAKHLVDNPSSNGPFIGLPTDEIYAKTLSILDKKRMAVVIVLDEIDKIDCTALYMLTRINTELSNAKLSVIGISNSLKFADSLEPRVKSSLSQQTLIFNPYNAEQLSDILKNRCQQALAPNVLSDDVIPLCAALAAQEHGDARRALDLLRVAVELAERNHNPLVTIKHVRLAQNKIEKDRAAEVIYGLPVQQRLVLHAINRMQRYKERIEKLAPITSGEMYKLYTNISRTLQYAPLTQRRTADFVSQLDMLGIIKTRVISKGRGGRTTEISVNIPSEELDRILQKDELYEEIDQVKMKNQMKLEN